MLVLLELMMINRSFCVWLVFKMIKNDRKKESILKKAQLFAFQVLAFRRAISCTFFLKKK